MMHATCLYLHAFIDTHTHTRTHPPIHTYIYIYIYICTNISPPPIHTHARAHMCICMYTYTPIYIERDLAMSIVMHTSASTAVLIPSSSYFICLSMLLLCWSICPLHSSLVLPLCVFMIVYVYICLSLVCSSVSLCSLPTC